MLIKNPPAPRLINSGCPYNVPAGHYPNLNHVTEHYRQAYEAEEERKFKALQLKREAEAAEAQQKAEAQKQEQQAS